jgi:hypothetical protein
MDKKMMATLDRVESLINTTMVSADTVTQQVDKTAKDATGDLNNTVT